MKKHRVAAGSRKPVTRTAGVKNIMFFYRRNRRQPWIRGGTPAEQLLRFFGLIAIFAGAAWLFWVNSENNLEKIQAMGAVDDKGHVLSKDQRKALIDISRIYKEDFGLVLKVRIGPVDDLSVDNTTKTLLFVLDPVNKEADFVLPPLVRRALGPEFVETLRTRYFPAYFVEDNVWFGALVDVLEATWRQLKGDTTPNTPTSGEEK